MPAHVLCNSLLINPCIAGGLLKDCYTIKDRHTSDVGLFIILFALFALIQNGKQSL